LRTEIAGWRRLAAGIAGAACVAAVVIAVLLATAAGGSNGSYTVRAIFDDAGFLISGENVKIDGVKVGTVDSVTPTPQAKAAVVFTISNPGFEDFRSDASCTIRPQALIGEKYVDCLPTQPRTEGAPLPPPLSKVPKGQEGEGDYLLPVQNTSSPVDVDLLGDIQRLPERERFTLILNELGAGLAGRGSDLSEVVKRANPALRELDRVLAILAGENHVLAKLAVDGDKALAPFAKVRERVADFIVQANKVSQAGAATRGALAENLKDFPPALRQFGPAMERIQKFAEQTIPTFTNLEAAAPAIDKVFTSLPGFSKSSEKFFESAGATAKQTGPALAATKPLLKHLRSLGSAAVPFTSNFSELLGSLSKTGGLERIMDFIFLGTGVVNGYDSLGHFLRSEGVGNLCTTYTIETSSNAGCRRKLFSSGSSGASSTSATAASNSEPTIGLVMARTLAVLKGATPAQALAKYPGSAPTPGELAADGQTGSNTSAEPVGGSTSGTTYYTPSSASSEAGGLLLNYLLGNE
jgi:phospholipid/cholesterol/gamma-HCH transport system substrate-binding protein